MSADVLRESSVGFIAASGDPISNASNALYGVDFLFLNSRLRNGRTIEAEAWFQDSPSGDTGQGSSTAWGLGVRLPNAEGWRVGFYTRELGAQFCPALGFVSRRGVRDSVVDAGYTRTVRTKWLQTVYAGADAERIASLHGGLQTQVISLRPLELETRGRAILRFVATFSEEVLAAPFTNYQDPGRRVVVPAGRYEFNDQGIDLDTGTQRTWSGRLSLRRGQFYDGKRRSVGGDVTWSPSRHLALKTGFDLNQIDLPEGDFSTRILRASSEVNFSSTLSWITLMQYDNVSELAGLQTRLQWVPKAGKKYFLVAIHSLEDFDRDGAFRTVSTEIRLRAGYTLRF